jgi:hypothetical protein
LPSRQYLAFSVLFGTTRLQFLVSRCWLGFGTFWRHGLLSLKALARSHRSLSNRLKFAHCARCAYKGSPVATVIESLLRGSMRISASGDCNHASVSHSARSLCRLGLPPAAVAMTIAPPAVTAVIIAMVVNKSTSRCVTPTRTFSGWVTTSPCSGGSCRPRLSSYDRPNPRDFIGRRFVRCDAACVDIRSDASANLKRGNGLPECPLIGAQLSATPQSDCGTSHLSLRVLRFDCDGLIGASGRQI